MIRQELTPYRDYRFQIKFGMTLTSPFDASTTLSNRSAQGPPGLSYFHFLEAKGQHELGYYADGVFAGFF